MIIENYEVEIQKDEETGIVRSESWKLNNRLHRADGPAKTEYAPDGTIVEECWYLDGHQHRGGEMRAAYGKDPKTGILVFEHWYVAGRLHRTGRLPAEIERDAVSGAVTVQGWYNHGRLHQVDGPAYLAFYPNGLPCRQEWRINGQRHRTDGPALITYHNTGQIKGQEWYKRGTPHVRIARSPKLS